MTRHWFLVLAAVVAAACQSTAPAPAPSALPEATPAPAAAAAPQASPTPAPARLPEAFRWVRDSAEHRAIYLQVYRQATERVEREAVRHPAGTWAVVLDADETVIDNSPYEIERSEKGLPFNAASWRAWTEKRAAVPLPGAAAFLARVHELGGKIAIVTNRAAGECPDTEANFRAEKLPFDVMLCKPAGGPGDKNPRFEAVANGTTPAGLPPLTIVAFLGDNIFDFPGLSQAIAHQGDPAFSEFGREFFVLPNPMYGSWH
ncbi:MAG: HAD family acid phosphatase [Thermoanaerobaculaceae bacterium]|nr:HAD family acid phosphatase [Thermoanaerobaculaceae bacterium]